MEKILRPVWAEIDLDAINTKELQNIMGIGKNTAYKLVKLKGFPSIKIGNKILIPHNKLYDWIEKNNGSNIIL